MCVSILMMLSRYPIKVVYHQVLSVFFVRDAKILWLILCSNLFFLLSIPRYSRCITKQASI